MRLTGLADRFVNAQKSTPIRKSHEGGSVF